VNIGQPAVPGCPFSSLKANRKPLFHSDSEPGIEHLEQIPAVGWKEQHDGVEYWKKL
jgi:hypothetical protein